MTVKAATISDVSPNGDGSAMLAVWPTTTEADTFGAIKMPGYAARVVSIQGTFGGATVVLAGSVDGTNYSNLSNPAGSTISKTGAAVVGVWEAPLYYQPSASGGTGQGLVVSMLFTNPRRFPS